MPRRRQDDRQARAGKTESCKTESCKTANGKGKSFKGKSFKGMTGMSARGQFISARSRSVAASPPLPIWELAAGILALFLINLVAIAAFLATVAQAVA